MEGFKNPFKRKKDKDVVNLEHKEIEMKTLKTNQPWQESEAVDSEIKQEKPKKPKNPLTRLRDFVGKKSKKVAPKNNSDLDDSLPDIDIDKDKRWKQVDDRNLDDSSQNPNYATLEEIKDTKEEVYRSMYNVPRRSFVNDQFDEEQSYSMPIKTNMRDDFENDERYKPVKIINGKNKYFDENYIDDEQRKKKKVSFDLKEQNDTNNLKEQNVVKKGFRKTRLELTRGRVTTEGEAKNYAKNYAGFSEKELERTESEWQNQNENDEIQGNPDKEWLEKQKQKPGRFEKVKNKLNTAKTTVTNKLNKAGANLRNLFKKNPETKKDKAGAEQTGKPSGTKFNFKSFSELKKRIAAHLPWTEIYAKKYNEKIEQSRKDLKEVIASLRGYIVDDTNEEKKDYAPEKLELYGVIQKMIEQKITNEEEVMKAKALKSGKDQENRSYTQPVSSDSKGVPEKTHKTQLKSGQDILNEVKKEIKDEVKKETKKNGEETKENGGVELISIKKLDQTDNLEIAGDESKNKIEKQGISFKDKDAALKFITEIEKGMKEISREREVDKHSVRF